TQPEGFLQTSLPVCLFILQRTAHQMGNVLAKKRESRYPPQSQTEIRPTQYSTNATGYGYGRRGDASDGMNGRHRRTAQDPPRIKLDNTYKFDRQRQSATDWIKKKHVELMDLDADRGPNSEKARQLRAIEDTLNEGEDLLSDATVTAEQMLQRTTCPFRVGRQHLQLVQSWSMMISLFERLQREFYTDDSGQDGRRRRDGE
uniref:Tektin n=1 Tax=Macrostomum lignano TaxID=282301 RepID=A0A1I8IZA4_9PLAT